MATLTIHGQQDTSAVVIGRTPGAAESACTGRTG